MGRAVLIHGAAGPAVAGCYAENPGESQQHRVRFNEAIAAGYYLRIVAVCYLRPAPDDRTPATACSALRAGLGLCAVATIALFVFPRVLSMPAGRAGDALAAAPQRSAVAELPARTSP